MLSNKKSRESTNRLIFEERIYLSGIMGCSLGILTGLWSILVQDIGNDMTLLSTAAFAAVAVFVFKALLDKAYIRLFVPMAVDRCSRSGITRTKEELVMNTPLPEIIWPSVILSAGIAFAVIELNFGDITVVWASACTGLVIGFFRQWSDKWHNLQVMK